MCYWVKVHVWSLYGMVLHEDKDLLLFWKIRN